MKTRLILGPVIIAALIGLLVLDRHLERPYAFFGLCSLAALGVSLEVAKMLRSRGLSVDYAALFLTGLALFGVMLFSESTGLYYHMNAIALSLAFLVVAFGVSNVWNKEAKDFLPQLAGTLTTYCYVFLPVATVLAVRLVPEHGEWLVYWLIAVAKLSDSGAYFTGKAIGKRKLIPHVSPGKTIEGLAGGLITAGVTGLVCWLAMPGLDDVFNLPAFVGLSVGMGFVAAHGDLVASALKRGAEAKDSGKLLPEFGGVLDLVDNFMLAGPALILVLVFVL